jgi:D-psicose/D-tagatose/L-ribulose 3-epimerase
MFFAAFTSASKMLPQLVQTKRDRLMRLAALGQVLASTDLELAIEPINRHETFFLNTAEQEVRLCRAIGNARIGLLLDVAHMAIEEKSLVAAVTAAGDGLKHLHLIENDRGAPGTGSLIDWKLLFTALNAIGYRGGYAIESFPFEDQNAAMKTRTWRPFATSSDQLARDGIAFLKRMDESIRTPSRNK